MGQAGFFENVLGGVGAAGAALALLAVAVAVLAAWFAAKAWARNPVLGAALVMVAGFATYVAVQLARASSLFTSAERKKGAAE